MLKEIKTHDLKQRLSSSTDPILLLDVRENWEFEHGHIEGSVHMPMHLVPLKINELPDDVTIVTICHHGVRSYQVGLYLSNAGFDSVLSLQGGLDAWSQEIDPTIPRY